MTKPLSLKPTAADDIDALSTCLARYAYARWDDATHELILVPGGRNSDQPYRVPKTDFRTHYWSDDHCDDQTDDLLLEFHFNLADVHCYAATKPLPDQTGAHQIRSVGFFVPRGATRQ